MSRKCYLVFAGQDYEERGGIFDLVCVCATSEEAQQAGDKIFDDDKYTDWAHIVESDGENVTPVLKKRREFIWHPEHNMNWIPFDLDVSIHSLSDGNER